jgi:hypothetical protein
MSDVNGTEGLEIPSRAAPEGAEGAVARLEACVERLACAKWVSHVAESYVRTWPTRALAYGRACSQAIYFPARHKLLSAVVVHDGRK